MKDRIRSAVKDALRSRDSVAADTLRGLLSEIQYAEMKGDGGEISDVEAVAIVRRELKKREEEAGFAEKAGRADKLAVLVRESDVLKSFLPAQLGEKELEEILTRFKESVPGFSLPAAMQMLKSEHAGRFDAKTASAVAKRLAGG